MTTSDSLVARATPPRVPAVGDGRTKAAGSVASLVMRVLSPRMLPPVRVDDGSTASTATRCPWSISRPPRASMKVDLPTPGTPVMPTRWAGPACGSSLVSTCWARTRWSGRLDSTSVIARAMPARDRARTASACRAAASGPSAASVTLPPGSRRRFASGGQLRQQVVGRVGDDSAGAEDRGRAGRAQLAVVLGRDDPADHHHDVTAPLVREGGLEVGHEGQVTGGERVDADDMDVGPDGLAGHLAGSLEQRPHVHVEAEVSERAGDDLLAAVMAVLAHLGDEDPGTAPLGPLELGRRGADPLDAVGLASLLPVHTADCTDVPGVAAEHLLQRVGDLAHGRLRPGGVDGQRQQVVLVPVTARPAGGGGQPVERRLAGGRVALLAEPAQLLDLLGADRPVVDLEHVDVVFPGDAVPVHSDHRLAAGVDSGLGAGGRLLDPHLRYALLDRAGHPAGRLDLLNVGPGTAGELVGEPLDVGAAAPGVDDPAGARFLLP